MRPSSRVGHRSSRQRQRVMHGGNDQPTARQLFDRSAPPPVVARRHQDWWWVRRAATTRRWRATHPPARRAASGPPTACARRDRRNRCAPVRVSAASISAAVTARRMPMEYFRFSRADEIALERRLVPEIGELGMEFVTRRARRRAAPEHLPFLGIEQPGDGAHQRGLAGAVFAGEQHALARRRPRSSRRAAHGDRRATGAALDGQHGIASEWCPGPESNRHGLATDGF